MDVQWWWCDWGKEYKVPFCSTIENKLTCKSWSILVSGIGNVVNAYIPDDLHEIQRFNETAQTLFFRESERFLYELFK